VINWCSVEPYLQLSSASFAVGAAVTWLRASRIKVAEATPLLSAVTRSTARQSGLNAWAALLAAIAAVLQVPLAFMPTCWGGGFSW
jgi:hypothetical protein